MTSRPCSPSSPRLRSVELASPPPCSPFSPRSRSEPRAGVVAASACGSGVDPSREGAAGPAVVCRVRHSREGAAGGVVPGVDDGEAAGEREDEGYKSHFMLRDAIIIKINQTP